MNEQIEKCHLLINKLQAELTELIHLAEEYSDDEFDFLYVTNYDMLESLHDYLIDLKQ